MGKSKAQGTAWETELVNRFNSEELHAERIAEGGANDIGDIRLRDVIGDEWIIEAKATERLNVTRVLSKARAKSGTAGRAVLIWRRLVKTDKKVRQADGEKVVVVMTLDQFIELMQERSY